MEMMTAADRPGRTILAAGFGEEGTALPDTLPALPPIIAHETTEYGWRGLTARGEVFEVRGRNGDRVTVPTDDFIEMRDGEAVGRRPILNSTRKVDVGQYLDYFGRAVELYRSNKNDAALAEIDAAIAIAPTLRARFNRALILLAGGRWREGFAQFEDRLEFGPPVFPAPPAGIPRWFGGPPGQPFGQDLAGKRLVLVHEQGFGDTVMMLRFVPVLKAMGADVVLDVPVELARLALQLAPIVTEAGADYWCPMMSLLHVLDIVQGGPSVPYLGVNPFLMAAMYEAIGGAGGRKRIGIAWSVGRDVEGDFPRSIPLPLLVGALGGDDVELYSLQTQGAHEAAAFGVQTPHLADFADVAALASLMDEIVAIDTAALHVAGATGHGNVTGLLSHWCSWRWGGGNPFYPRMKLCRQILPGDWGSALAQMGQ